MADENIGTARIDIKVDTSQFDTAIDAAKSRVNGFTGDAATAYDGMTAAQKRAADSLSQMADKINLTKQEQIVYNATLKDLPTAVLDELKVKLAASAAASATAGEAVHEFGLNNSFARRELGRLVSDIANGNYGRFEQTSLTLANASGLLSLAFSATGAAVIGSIAAFGAFAVAAAKGAAEASNFNKALILTGGYAGETAGDMTDMATAIANATGGSRGSAVTALTDLANGGKVAGDQFDEVATAAVNMSAVTGTSVDTIVQQFESLADKPTEAISKLNDQYHFLTASQYEEIATLEREGQTQDATRLATDLYAAAINTRTAEIKANLGLLERAWDSIKDHASAAWAAMEAVGAPDTLGSVNSKIAELNDQLAKAGGAGAASGGSETALGGVTGRPNRAAQIVAALKTLSAQRQTLLDADTAAHKTALDQQTQDTATHAQSEIDILAKTIATNQQKREADVKKIKAMYADLAKANPGGSLTSSQSSQEAQLIAAANEKYKDKAGSAKAVTDDAATKMLQTLRDQGAALEAELVTNGKLGTSAQQLAKFEQQISDLKNKSVLTADQKSLLANQSAIEIELQKNVALDKQVAYKAAIQKLDERSAQINAANATALQSQQDQYAREEGAFGQGTQEQQRVGSEQSIRNSFTRQNQQLAKAATDGTLSSPDYAKAQTDLQNSLDAQLAALKQHYANVDDLQSNWELGVSQAFANYTDSAKNAYQEAGNAFKSVTSGMEDAFASFVTTGKLSFSDLTNSIISDLAKMAAHQAIAGLAGSLDQALGSGGASLTGLIKANASSDPIGSLITSIGQGHADGGPVSAGITYPVNERGDPELLNTGGKQYLMMNQNSGSVTPMKALQGGTGQAANAPNVQINVVNNSSQPITATQSAPRIDAGKQVIDLLIKDAQTNGKYVRTLKGALG
jgi:lambda family phage tail tape measure protein